MPDLRSYYPAGASATEVGAGAGVDPTAALQALIGQESMALTNRANSAQSSRASASHAPAFVVHQPTETTFGNQRMEDLELRQKQIAVANAADEANYQRQLRAADISGPKQRYYEGGPQVIGGLIDDEKSVPLSMRGKGSGNVTLTGSTDASSGPSPADYFTALNYRAATDGGQSLAQSNARRGR